MRARIGKYLIAHPRIHAVVADGLSAALGWRVRVSKEPYFGAHQAAKQMVPERAAQMRRLATTASLGKDTFAMIEIGSWAGQSTLLWADELTRHTQPRIFCIDPWAYYAALDTNPSVGPMRKAAREDTIFSLFWRNVRAAGREGIIIPLRGFSQDILPYLAPHTFDLIYIDGDHAYRSVASDISLSLSAEARRLALWR